MFHIANDLLLVPFVLALGMDRTRTRRIRLNDGNDRHSSEFLTR